MRERGLKANWEKHQNTEALVAPYAGAWIERLDSLDYRVNDLSLPMRERGLKENGGVVPADLAGVAPYAGAWIERSCHAPLRQC